MKIAILKIGARVGSGGSSAGSGDTLMIAGMLHSCGVTIDIYTKIIDKDSDFYKSTSFNWFDLLDNHKNINSNNYDALIVMNGNVNFYGGVENPYDIYNYICLNNFDNQIFYIMCDCNLSLKQILKSIRSKEWGNKYTDKDIDIVRKDIVYITQINNLKVAKEKIIDKNGIEIKNLFYYPLEKFPLLKDRRENVTLKTIDLKYGGAFRNKQREKKMVEFLFGHPSSINVEIFGTIRLDKFDEKLIKDLCPPNFSNAVKYSDFIHNMCNSLSTIIIGDKIYEGNVLTQRIYESVLANNIVFIDREFDPFKKVFSDDFHYVKDREELSNKIIFLKNNNKKNKDICDFQYEHVKIDKDKYCQDFTKLIRSCL